MSKRFKYSALLAGIVLAAGISAGSIVRADTTAPPAPSTPSAPAPTAKPAHHTGSVTAVDGTAGKITIQNKKGDPETFTTNTDTKIHIKGQKGALLTDIQVGWDATIVSADGTTATEIHARPHVTKPAAAPAQ